VKTGALTVAVIVASVAGVVKPAAVVLAETTVAPPPTGWKLVVRSAIPPVNTTGDAVIVPTERSVLVTFTFTVKPPATAWVADPGLPDESSGTAKTSII
jgi:hypothetical protein